ncbi:DJ-1/PfpI family protein [Streptomyces sp. H10-C2]|uniref:DJ-1/PfpI family protein n=1 Tax=unclassified Streptomyces TaxID=2593676 RepID=UPI0024BB8C1B|nr:MULTISPECIES: DJ-1/PfpI family protein [unclassified Streptomyces]MDJ0344135.1 DJ-1/PfpI family protein [Streptomyces sp. PH10-H1]MDJ0374891.1 DJ-1/PfpI family protein [Streptomyces sp. H10-C2]
METREYETQQTRQAQPKKIVHVAVYDTLADWETGHAIAHINSPQWQREPGRYQVRTVGMSPEPVTTAGGVRIVPDTVLGELRPQDSALLILTGAYAWDLGEDNAAFARTAREFLAAGVPVAAICGATAGLAREGLLDDREHTSAAAEYLAATGYRGGEHYRETDALTGGDLITAGPTEPVAFAREIFAKLDLYEPDVLDAWYRLFANSDASAFSVLMAAGS